MRFPEIQRAGYTIFATATGKIREIHSKCSRPGEARAGS